MSATEEVAQSLRAAPALDTAMSSSSQVSTQSALPGYSEAMTGNNSSISHDISPGSSSQATSSDPVDVGRDTFFDIAPRSDSTSFQVGYLGLKGFQAWLKGDVLVKLDTETKRRGRYTRCIVMLQAKEEANNAIRDDHRPSQKNAVELFSHTLVLWDADKEATSSSATLPTVPSTMPFSFPLTSDLPHCVHLRDSSLTYTITAQLFSDNASKLPHAIKTVPVHLVRYTRPGPLNKVELGEIDGAALPNQQFTLEPFNWIEQLPTLVYAQINRTIFRRADPIDIRVRIPSPDPTSISEKGLKLRAVEADLVRIIHVKQHAVQKNGDANVPTVSQARASDEATDPHAHQALLAHSGKLCRFHSQRPVLLRLTLHPPFDRANMPHPHPDHDALVSGPVFGRGGGGGCESISQETLMHRVSFEVRIKVGILGGRGERRDIVLRRAVRILPGAAGALENPEHSEPAGRDALSEKERLKRNEKARMLAEDDNTLASSSRIQAYADDMLDFAMEDEYDGYEDVGRSLDDLMDAAMQSDVAGSSSQAVDHVERLEQLRQYLEISDPASHDDGPPPSLLDSRNDLQVEVQVEGVGLAVPRLPHRHPADPYPDMDGTAIDAFPPPPPIDDTGSHPAETSSAYAVLSRPANSATFVPPHPDDPPPPLSPVVDRSGAQDALNSGSDSISQAFRSDLLFPPSQHDAEVASPAYMMPAAQPSAVTTMMHGDDDSHPSYEAAMSSASTRLAEVRGIANHHEPPPYAHESSHPDPAPSFDQAVRQHSTDGRAELAQSEPSATELYQRESQVMAPHLSQDDDSNATNGHHRPPAYGTSQHPPSYDA